MNRFVRLPALFVLLGLIPLFSLGCPQSGGTAGSGLKRIVILTNGDDPFWDACEAGAKAAERDLKLKEAGYVVTFDRADFTDKGQVDKIKQYAQMKDLVGFGISVTTPDTPSIALELKSLRDRGVHVITIDNDVDRNQYRDSRFAYLGTDNLIAGEELGKVAKQLDPQGNYACFVGILGAANAVARMQGFDTGAAGLTPVTRLEDRGDRPTARKNVQDALDRHPNLNMLVGIWAYNTPQQLAVVKDRNLKGKVKVLAFDADAQSIIGMKEGLLDAMIVQNPYQMGFVGVELLKSLSENDQDYVKTLYPDYAQEAERDMFKTELRVVVPDESSPVDKTKLFNGTVFMTFPEFEAWLRERNLNNS